MEDKLRLILILIVAAGAGIVIVLGSWLYGSYNQRMELFLAIAERTLFDAIQETIQQQEDAGTRSFKQARRTQPIKFMAGVAMGPAHTQRLVSSITKAFPNVHPDSLAFVLDSFQQHEHDSFFKTRRKLLSSLPEPTRPGRGLRLAVNLEPGDRPRQLLPNFLFGQAPLDSTALLRIEEKFAQGLANNGIRTDFTLSIAKAPSHLAEMLPGDSTTLTPAALGLPFPDSISGKGLAIRPILVDPENGGFISVSFNHPWQYLLYNLSWHLIISVTLVATIIGCFVYLFHTIFKQNKLAVLRKTFVNNMTHEFRTPIATVSAAVQALQSYADTEDEKRRDRYLSISKEELDHLSSMIDNVLQVAEGEHHTIKLQCRHYSLIDLIRRCIANAEINTGPKHVDFQFIPTHNIEALYGDPEHMKNVVTNLLDNAVKYGATQITVVVQPSKGGKFVKLQVHDNGIGIPRAYQHQIFKPFFRVPRSNTDTTKGFGLGLSYVKQVILRHGGTITLDSTPGEGSIFTLSIPKNANA